MARDRGSALPIYYTSGYDLNLGPHVFPSQKYALVHDRLIREADFEVADFLTPPQATTEQLALVHTPQYIQKVMTGSFSLQELMRLEIRYSSGLLRACLLSAGGTIEACRLALQTGLAVNLGGGFHHAYADHGEGFCLLNDIAVGLAFSLESRWIKSAMVVDCDVHQGNGTASIFRDNAAVYTVSLHQENNYPIPKEKSDFDVGLADGSGDEQYLQCLKGALDRAFRQHTPDLLVFVAGADPYCWDQLGGLALSLDGLLRRDRMVLERAAAQGCPTVITLAGGYALNVADTVSIHVNTIVAAQKLLAEVQ